MVSFTDVWHWSLLHFSAYCFSTYLFLHLVTQLNPWSPHWSFILHFNIYDLQEIIFLSTYPYHSMKLSMSMFIFFLKPFPHITYHTTRHVEVSGQWMCCIWGHLTNPYPPNNSYHSGLNQILQSIKNNCIYGHGHYYELSVVPGKLCSWFLLVCLWEI